VKTLVCCQEFEVVAYAELGEKGIDGPELLTSSPANIPETCCFNVIAPVWHEQR